MVVDNRSSRRALLGTALAAVLALMLQACSSDGKNDSLFPLPVVKLFVPDSNNNRVLIYDSPFINGQAASVVLGQAGFTTNAAGTAASAMSKPAGVTLDRSGNLYVSDSSNCRVLQYKPKLVSGMSAAVALGQPDLTTGNCSTGPPPPPTDSNLDGPAGVATDSSGNVWVADGGYSRVLEYTGPLSNGKAASTVIGQPDFNTGANCPGNSTPTASTLCNVQSVAFDGAGNLWVADFGSNRVLRYSPQFSNHMDATLELGQPSGTAFTSGSANNGGISASTLAGPNALAFDSSGNLWVADGSNHRVLMYRTPFSNGMAASVVLGQPDFTSNTPNHGNGASADANGFVSPAGLQFDSDGGLFVGDSNNNRTLRFAPPFSNGMAATTVLGQTNFTSNSANQGSSNPSATSQDRPFGAGPSFIALAVLAALVLAWFFMKRRQATKRESQA